MNTRFRTFFTWMVIVLLVYMAFSAMDSINGSDSEELTYSELLNEVERSNVKSVTIKGNQITGTLRQGLKPKFSTFTPEDKELIGLLRLHNVEIVAEDDREPLWASVLIYSLPILILVGIWIFTLRQMQGGGKGALSFGKSRAKPLSPLGRKVTFADVAGIDEAKEELQEIIDFLRDPSKFQKLGGRIPKGVLLAGPPGTGKTLLARAIAGEAEVPFFSISGSDFVEMFVGVGASRVRDLFDQGKKHAPCLIFMDEIDAVGRHRGAGLGGGHDEREQTLNQLLVELDGFEDNDGVIMIAATNRPDILDPALLRPGRFDRQVIVDRPDIKGRQGILKVHSAKVTVGNDVDFEVLARGTPGFSGADLANLVNEAALLAAREEKLEVGAVDFERAKDKVLMGVERRSLIISESERLITANHEAGHALVAHLLPDTDPIHKVTIIPRGRALGLTQQLPLDDRHNYIESQLRNDLAILMGGRVAEKISLKEYSSGASNDLDRATDIARKMICRWGMNEKLGPMTFGKQEEQVFLGRELGNRINFSEETARLIDIEIKKLVIEAERIAITLINTNRTSLDAIVEALLEFEVLDGNQIREIVDASCKDSIKEEIETESPSAMDINDG